MAVSVVDPLEMIDIEQYERQGVLVPDGVSDLPVSQFHECSAIEKPCQEVGPRQLFKPGQASIQCPGALRDGIFEVMR